MLKLLLGIGVGIGVLWAIVWTLLEYLHKRATLGKTDFSPTVHEILCYHKDGAALLFRSLRGLGAVQVLKRSSTPLLVEVRLVRKGLTADDASKLRALLSNLKIEHEQWVDCNAQDADTVSFALSGDAVKMEHWGRIVDESLRTVGLKEGERYIFESRGSVDVQQLSDLVKRKWAE